MAFITRKGLKDVPAQDFNTPRGTIRVSTPEASAVDLVGYHHHVGGLDHVATILSEMVERIDPEKLLAAAQTAPLPWSQRLGYLLDRVGSADKSTPLKAHVGKMAQDRTPPARCSRTGRAPRWRVETQHQRRCRGLVVIQRDFITEWRAQGASALGGAGEPPGTQKRFVQNLEARGFLPRMAVVWTAKNR